MDQFNRFCCGSNAVWRIDQLKFIDVELMLACNRGDLACRPYERWDDDPGLGSFDSPAKRRFVAGMHHNRFGCRCLLRSCDQAVIF